MWHYWLQTASRILPGTGRPARKKWFGASLRDSVSPANPINMGIFGNFGKVTGFSCFFVEKSEKPKSGQKTVLLAVLPPICSRDTVPT
jgi:hypothetical protein